MRFASPLRGPGLFSALLVFLFFCLLATGKGTSRSWPVVWRSSKGLQAFSGDLDFSLPRWSFSFLLVGNKTRKVQVLVLARSARCLKASQGFASFLRGPGLFFFFALFCFCLCCFSCVRWPEEEESPGPGHVSGVWRPLRALTSLLQARGLFCALLVFVFP